ncbi:hypothetical protein, partial [Streptosporangium amethystogenes]|uniref:hypothetical protein n=1 Tax=Streptosporangium amethystogenes TaxID=2002 RepID=UPI0031D79A11
MTTRFGVLEVAHRAALRALPGVSPAGTALLGIRLLFRVMRIALPRAVVASRVPPPVSGGGGGGFAPGGVAAG